MSHAVKIGNPCIVKLLIDEGKELQKVGLARSIDMKNQHGETPFHVALLYEHQEIVELLLKYGADINAQTKEGMTALQWAAKYGHVKVVEFLLSNGANPSMKDLYGITAQKWAVEKGYKNIQQLLLDRDDDEDDGVYDEEKLSLAAALGNKEIAELFLSKGSDINGKDSKIPLHAALVNERLEMAELLLKKGANVNVQDERGITALQWAAKKGKEEELILLLQYGADPTIQDKNNKTASDFAEENQHKKIIQRLQNPREKVARFKI